MDVSKLGKLTINKNHDAESLKSVVSKSFSGNTIIFLGAGFSVGCENETGKSIPLAKDLSKDICKLGGFEEDEDLAYSADRYLKFGDPAKLIGLLNSFFLIIRVSDYHRAITQLIWRRVYTTNYDDAYEIAAGLNGRLILPLTLEDNPSEHFKNKDVCIHINGAIQNLNKDTLDKSFKLSDSSYTNSDAFSDSSWEYRFRKDLELCSQIIFIGYSLYDMEVKRLLVSNENIKKKTFFITKEGISQKDHHRLSSYGEVFPIGVKKFGEMLEKNKPDTIPHGLNFLSALSAESLSHGSSYTDSNIRDFLLRGKFDSGCIASSLTSATSLFAVLREQVAEVQGLLKANNVIAIHSALANGKSVILKQLVSSLLIEGKLVYSIKDREADYEHDIEQLAKLNQTIYLVVDDFEDCVDIVRYFNLTLRDNGKVILAERPNRYRRALGRLRDYGIDACSINADYLHGREIEELESIISSTGLWGELGGKGREQHLRYLTSDCESQLSLVLMKILKSPDILSRFSNSFASILKYPETKKTVHAICLIQHVCPSKCTRSFVSDIAGSTHVYTSEFEDRINESDIFDIRGNEVVTRSSIFGTFILNSLYKSSYSIDQLVRIAEKLQRNKGIQSSEENDMYRSIMKFGTISSILPDDDKPNCYIEFYEKIKREVPAVIGNPHYWLQYAMAIMTTDNLSDAEIILNTAYAKAKNNPDYDTSYIDNQSARLNLRKSIVESEPKKSFDYFVKAHNILKKEEPDIYKFRQAGLYVIFYQEKYELLARGDKVNFEHSMKNIIKQYEEFLAYEYPNGDVPPFHSENVTSFREVIKNIQRLRK